MRSGKALEAVALLYRFFKRDPNEREQLGRLMLLQQQDATPLNLLTFLYGHIVHMQERICMSKRTKAKEKIIFYDGSIKMEMEKVASRLFGEKTDSDDEDDVDASKAKGKEAEGSKTAGDDAAAAEGVSQGRDGPPVLFNSALSFVLDSLQDSEAPEVLARSSLAQHKKQRKEMVGQAQHNRPRRASAAVTPAPESAKEKDGNPPAADATDSTGTSPAGDLSDGKDQSEKKRSGEPDAESDKQLTPKQKKQKTVGSESEKSSSEKDSSSEATDDKESDKAKAERREQKKQKKKKKKSKRSDPTKPKKARKNDQAAG